MRKGLLFATALAITVGAASLGNISTAAAQPYGGGGYGPGGYGPGWMHGPGMMGGWGGGYGPGYGMGPGMMGWYGPGWGPGYGPGYGRRGPWGPGWYGAPPADLNLSTTDVKNQLERWLAWQGNPRLKVGDVKEKDADTITADIVTKDGSSLVERFEVNRHTGFYRPES